MGWTTHGAAETHTRDHQRDHNTDTHSDTQCQQHTAGHSYEHSETAQCTRTLLSTRTRMHTLLSTRTRVHTLLSTHMHTLLSTRTSVHAVVSAQLSAAAPAPPWCAGATLPSPRLAHQVPSRDSRGHRRQGGHREAQGPVAVWALRLADGAHTVHLSRGSTVQPRPPGPLVGGWRLAEGSGLGHFCLEGPLGLTGRPQGRRGPSCTPNSGTGGGNRAQPTGVLQAFPLPVCPQARPRAGGPCMGQASASGLPAIPPPPASGSSLPTPRVKPPAPSSPPHVRRWRGQPGAREQPGFPKSGPLGEWSGPPPRFLSRRCLKLSAGPGGSLRLHALFPDSIHLSKLIFDIHSDLEGRHGDNSRKVENNIIATNMNYWPPG